MAMETSPPHYFLTSLHLLLALTCYVNTCLAARVPAGKTSNEFIKASCSSTTYPSLCFTSLSSHTSYIQTSPKLLAHAALSIALDSAYSTSAMMLKLSQARGSMEPRVAAAMSDCVEELGDSVEELRESISEMGQLGGSSDFKLLMNNIETWVSAALTDDDTCTDGFAGDAANDKIKSVVRGQVINVAQLTSNALALINRYASLLG